MSEYFYRVVFTDMKGGKRYMSGGNHSNDLYKTEGAAKGIITQLVKYAQANIKWRQQKMTAIGEDIVHEANRDNYSIEKFILMKVIDD